MRRHTRRCLSTVGASTVGPLVLGTRILAVVLIGLGTSNGQSSDYVAEILADRPVGYWRFEEVQTVEGSVARHTGGDERTETDRAKIDGVCHGTVVSADGVPGIGGRALRFDGASGYIHIPAHPLFQSDAVTVEFWFRSEQRFDRISSASFVSKADRSDDGSGYWSVTGTSEIPGRDQGRLVSVTGPKDGGDHFVFSTEAVQLNDGQWHHLVFSRSTDGEKRLYVDGELSASANDGTVTVINDGPIYLGASSVNKGDFLSGEMDEVAIYANTLSPQRVAIHYATAVYGSRLPEAVARRVDFVGEVQPILRNHCIECHGKDIEEGGLNLSVRSRVLEGGDSVIPIVPNHSEASPLIQLVAGLNGDRVMPPDGDRLTSAQISVLRTWVDQGANWPDAAAGVDRRTIIARKHWAFQPIARPTTPTVSDATWIRNDIDAFVLARLETAGIRPAEPADSLTLVRRAHFDLIGLPPSPEMVSKYSENRDARFESFEEVIDQLLRSEHYGERYGRHWLDIVRYSDSAGYELDTFYEHAWKYRDYVIESFNRDKPFDQFIHEQLAADEVWPTNKALHHATGLLAIGPYHFESGIFRPEIQEYKWLTDVADTVGSAFLGLTVGCARCHSHKFDPISQKDYFGLQAIFAGATLWDERTNRPPDNSAERRKPQNWIVVNREIPAPVRVLYRGNLKSPGVTAAPAIFRALEGGGAFDETDPEATQQRRTKLARWLTSSDNPLTARVLANRVWQWHFGEGLVRTPNDFGTQGAPPTHPQLLNYLADELRSNGWSLKHLHRLIMQSNTYRMSSHSADAKAAMTDPSNKLLWRYSRRRLEAEAIWDNLHATAGTLNRERFGTPVIPPVDEAILATKVNSNWNVTEDPSQWSRRGLYVIVRRSLKFPFFETFNLNEPSASCARRDSTIVSPQALTLLNDELILKQAQAFAGRLVRDCGDDSSELVRRAWLLAFSRTVSREELHQSVEFLEVLAQHFVGQGPDRFVYPTSISESPQFPPARAAALVEFCRALFNASEFIYID
jgi:mono/diheme cytochrome c family protein